MDKAKVTPKDFFLWASAMIAFYWSVFSFVTLFFSYIDYAFPDPLQYFPSDPYGSGISWQMASLIVMFPLYVLLAWLINRDTAADRSRFDIWVRRWAIVLTLFIAGITIAVDLVTLIMYFFNGEITVRFLLKVVLVLLVAAAILMHFLADMWGYWNINPHLRRRVGWGSAVLVVATVLAGFFIIGTPWQARLYRFDDQKIADLQTIQSQIISYWQAKQTLPDALSDLNNAISGFIVPVDPQNGIAYEYQASATTSFKLCATFNAQTQSSSAVARAIPAAPAPYGRAATPANDVWYHGAGRVCFTRTIDPALYPPLKKVSQN